MAPAPPRRPREAADAGVVAGAPVVDAGRRRVEHAAAEGVQSVLPVLLVAVDVEARIERADALERAAADGEVGAPHEARLGLLLAEVERGDRQRLAPARAQAAALQPRADRAADHVVVRVAR